MTDVMRRELVYWGPGLSGKRSHLRQLYHSWPEARRSPVARIGEHIVQFTLETHDPHAVTQLLVSAEASNRFHSDERLAMLETCDGVVFVADSQPERLTANQVSWEELARELTNSRSTSHDIPIVVALNKRDLPSALPTDALMNALHGLSAVALIETVARDTQHPGVRLAFDALCSHLESRKSPSPSIT